MKAEKHISMFYPGDWINFGKVTILQKTIDPYIALRIHNGILFKLPNESMPVYHSIDWVEKNVGSYALEYNGKLPFSIQSIKPDEWNNIINQRDDLEKLQDDEEYQQAETCVETVLNQWPPWKRDMLLSIFNLTIEKPEEESDPQGRPAVEFEAGTSYKLPYPNDDIVNLKLSCGAIYQIPCTNDYAAVCEECLKDVNAVPCEPDFEIVEYKGGKTWKELSVEYERAINELIMFVDPSMRYTPEYPMAVTEACIRKLKEQEEQRRNFAYGNASISNPNITREDIDKASDTPEDDAVGEDYVGELIDMVMNYEHSDRVLTDLLDAAKKARDQYERRQPTIPQEVRAFVEYAKDNRMTHNRDGGFSELHYDNPVVFRDKMNAALQALDRCESPKPHPLTKVRELVRYLHATLKHASMIEINQGSVTHQQVEAARRELQEYDGEVGDE